MNECTHSICRPCWLARCRAHGESARPPTVDSDPIVESCCYCGTENRHGIYVRDNFERLLCKGKHDRRLGAAQEGGRMNAMVHHSRRSLRMDCGDTSSTMSMSPRT